MHQIHQLSIIDPMSLTKKDIEHACKLAHIQVKEEKKDMYVSQLQDVLEHVKTLDQFDLTNVDPSSHALDQAQYLREDDVEDWSFDLEKNAPEWENDCFSVPKIGAESA